MVRRELQRRPSISVPQRSSRICSEPASPSLRRADHLTEAHQKHLKRLLDARPRLRTAWDALQELYGLYEANDLDQANQAQGRFADLYATGQIPENHEIAQPQFLSVLTTLYDEDDWPKSLHLL